MRTDKKGKKNTLAKDFSEDPFFVKKAQAMKDLIQKVGLPKDFPGPKAGNA